jgi:hypothetical protein
MDIQARALPAERKVPFEMPSAEALHLVEVAKFRGTLHLISTLASDSMTRCASPTFSLTDASDQLARLDAVIAIARGALDSVTAMQMTTKGSA